MLFDDVPGGAGHTLRLQSEDELKRVLTAAVEPGTADRPYPLPDRAGLIRTAVRDAGRLDVVADRVDVTGPPEAGPWYLHLLEAAARPGTRVRVAVRERPAGPAAAHLLALAPAGAGLFAVRPNAPVPTYGLLALATDGRPRSRSGCTGGTPGRPPWTPRRTAGRRG